MDEFGTSNATHANVSSANADTLLIAANKKRKDFSIFNDSTATLYIKFGSGASATSCAYKLPPGAMLNDDICKRWKGDVYGFWDAANGAARTVEYFR